MTSEAGGCGRKEKCLYLNNFNNTFYLLFDKGVPHFHFALQTLSPVLLIVCEAFWYLLLWSPLLVFKWFPDPERVVMGTWENTALEVRVRGLHSPGTFFSSTKAKGLTARPGVNQRWYCSPLREIIKGIRKSPANIFTRLLDSLSPWLLEPMRWVIWCLEALFASLWSYLTSEVSVIHQSNASITFIPKLFQVLGQEVTLYSISHLKSCMILWSQ